MTTATGSIHYEFSEQLRKLRKKQGLTQSDLARTLGVGQTAIANYENGTRKPDIQGLHKLADLLGVSIDILLGFSDPLTDLHSCDLTEAQKEFEQYLFAGKVGQALDRVIMLAENNVPVRQIYLQVIEPMLAYIGLPDYEDQQHKPNELLISQTIITCMEILRKYIQNVKNINKRFLNLMNYNDPHNIELNLLSEYLFMEGWEIVNYGNFLFSGDEKLQLIVTAITTLAPDIIGLSITIDPGISVLSRLISTIRAGNPDSLILVGGRVFLQDPFLWIKISADAFAQSALDVIPLLERIV